MKKDLKDTLEIFLEFHPVSNQQVSNHLKKCFLTIALWGEKSKIKEYLKPTWDDCKKVIINGSHTNRRRKHVPFMKKPKKSC